LLFSSQWIDTFQGGEESGGEERGGEGLKGDLFLLAVCSIMNHIYK